MHTAPSSQENTSARSLCAWNTCQGVSPIRFTAAPSTNGSIDSSVTGSPASIAARNDDAPTGSTPTTLVDGDMSATYDITPDIRPPPPTGTRTVSSCLPILDNCATISAATVPCPTTVLRESNGSITVAPRAAASSRAAWAASSNVLPVTTSSIASPPCTKMRSRFCFGVGFGTKILP